MEEAEEASHKEETGEDSEDNIRFFAVKLYLDPRKRRWYFRQE